jgi:hypothetical protein
MNTRKLLLLDKSALQRLNQDQRAQLAASKHTLLYPPILFAEIAQHGLDKPKALFNFKNTVNVYHWTQRAKRDLIIGEPSGHYNIGAKIPTTVLSEYPEADLKDLEEEAKDIVSDMVTEEERLKKHFSVLRESTIEYPILELVQTHEDVPDEQIVRKFNQVVRQSSHSSQKYPPSAFAKLIGEGRKGIERVRKILYSYPDLYDLLYNVDTLAKAQRWVEQVIYKDTESILDFLCNGSAVIPLSVNEQDKIRNRFRSEGKPHINDFAPYARVVTQLYLTIFLYLVENKDNSSPKGALRDFEYLYYVTDANVRFISGDKWHKRCVEEIPLLKNIQKNFMFLPNRKEDEEGFKKVLKSIGIKS